MNAVVRVICDTILLSALSFRAAAEDFTHAIPIQLNNSKPHVSLVAVPEPSAKAISNDHSRMTFPGVTTIWTIWNLVISALFLSTWISA